MQINIMTPLKISIGVPKINTYNKKFNVFPSLLKNEKKKLFSNLHIMLLSRCSVFLKIFRFKVDFVLFFKSHWKIISNLFKSKIRFKVFFSKAPCLVSDTKSVFRHYFLNFVSGQLPNTQNLVLRLLKPRFD